jgi:phosphotransferase family enzyme
MDEEQLAGGIANAGGVVRAGDHVIRPVNAYTHSAHALLTAVRQAGFAGASAPVGIDDDGRERLVYIDGDVPLPPYPGWAQSDAALASVATLLRRLHDAARAFDPGRWDWSQEMADPAGGSIVCHNDVCLENVVFRDGVAVGLLDFDFAAPGRPVYDLAQFARMCVPVDDETSAARLGWQPSDRPRRLRLVADAYGLDRTGRVELLGCLDAAIAAGGEFVRRRVAAGDVNFIKMWNDMGGAERFDRRRRWWGAHRDEFLVALS